MKKIKKCFKKYYKKVTIFLFVAFALCSYLVCEVGAVTYKYKVFEHYRNAVYDAYWQQFNGNTVDSSDYKLTWKQISMTDSNNRFATNLIPYGYDSSSEKTYDNLFRVDLIIRVNDNGVTFKAQDKLTWDIYYSTRFEMYDRIPVIPLQDASRYYLNYFRVWFADDTTFVYYPEKTEQVAFTINDMHIKCSTTLTTDKPRIVSYNFSFNLVNPAYQFYTSDGYTPLHANVWFNNDFILTVERDSVNSPIYMPPNNNTINDHNRVENDIKNDISSGLDQSQDIMQSVGDLTSNGSSIFIGLGFYKNILTKVFDIGVFGDLAQFSLSLGLFAFLVGMTSIVIGSVRNSQNNDNNSNKNNRSNRNDKGR